MALRINAASNKQGHRGQMQRDIKQLTAVFKGYMATKPAGKKATEKRAKPSHSLSKRLI